MTVSTRTLRTGYVLNNIVEYGLFVIKNKYVIIQMIRRMKCHGKHKTYTYDRSLWVSSQNRAGGPITGTQLSSQS